MRFAADKQVRAELDAPLYHGVHFLKKRGRVDYNAVPDDALLAFVKDAGGDEVQNEFIRTHDDRVARVVSALVPGDNVRTLGQQIYDLSLAFITPLGADND
jgi:hypothetical protein